MDDVAAKAFREHYERVYGFVRRRTSTHEHAEDVTQAVFVAAAEHLGRRAREARVPVLAWLFRVARNNLIDEARRQRRRGTSIPLEAVAEELEQPPQYGGEVARVLRRAFRRLPEAQRRIAIMRLLEGRSFAEIAVELGTSEAACKMRLARALTTMRAEFEREGIEP